MHSRREASGFKAWRRLSKHYDPRSAADKSSAYNRVANGVAKTFGKAKTLDEANLVIPKWENEVHAYGIRSKKEIPE